MKRWKVWAVAASVALTLAAGMWACGGKGWIQQADQAVDNGDGTITDSRDGKTYKTVTIGSQVWMAENLNYTPSTGSSWCYRDDNSNCAKYGRLYDWNTAMGGASSSSAKPSGVQGVCPVGWHLPSDAEWSALMTAVGGSSTGGTKLKSQTGWNAHATNPVGTDDYGFSALPGGERNLDVGDWFGFAGNIGFWWTATKHKKYGASYAYSWYMSFHSQDVHRGNSIRVGIKGLGYSVRCLRN